MTSVTTDRRFGVNGGLAFKAPVRVATTANITLSGLQTVDGVALAADDRVLVLHQTDTTTNGIYDASTAAWTRSIDANGNNDLALGTLVSAAAGAQAGQVWRCGATNPVLPGTSAMPWTLALAATAAPIVASIASLKTVDKTTSTKVVVLGYYAAGDGGGGSYYYDAADTTSSDNGGSIIVASDGGRWKLTLTGRVSVKQFGAKGDASTNDLTAIQNCYAVFQDAFWPNGTYTLGNNTWTPPVSFEMYGESRGGVKLTRTGSGPIITTPINTQKPVLENIYFTGSGNTGITVASTAGTLQGYLINALFRHCDFAWELAYGINADLIFGTIERCDFGYSGTVGGQPSPGASTMVCLKSVFYPATTNFSNQNVARGCKFWGGSSTVAAVQLASGISWKFEHCDWEMGGISVNATDVPLLEFSHCWFEQNVTANDLVAISGTAAVRATFRHCEFTNNTTGASRGIFSHASTVPVSFEITDCTIGKNGTTCVLYDGATTLNTLPAAGQIAFYNNTVSGGSTSDKVVTKTHFKGGPTSPRFTGVFGTSAGTIIDCSEPGMTINRNSSGDISIASQHPLSVSTSGIRVNATGRAGVVRASITDVNTIRLFAYQISSTGAAFAVTEDTIMVSVYGSTS